MECTWIYPIEEVRSPHSIFPFATFLPFPDQQVVGNILIVGVKELADIMIKIVDLLLLLK